MYPTKLNKIINLFESLPEDERETPFPTRTMRRNRTRESEVDLVDVRKTRNARTRWAFICRWMKPEGASHGVGANAYPLDDRDSL
jgi:hypothetical protein